MLPSDHVSDWEVSDSVLASFLVRFASPDGAVSSVVSNRDFVLFGFEGSKHGCVCCQDTEQKMFVVETAGLVVRYFFDFCAHRSDRSLRSNLLKPSTSE